MSDLGLQPAPQTVAPAAEPSSDTPLWVLLVAILVMLAMAAAAAFVLLRDTKEKTYPARWDSRVAPYVQLVQNKRGLFFLHPVEVRFLPEAKFEKTIAADETKKPSKKEREEIEQFTGLMRAFGLLKGEIDLSASVDDFSTGGTLAYYSFDDERITIRGEKVTPAVRATLVHELTHVLQDQHFKIGDRMEKLRKADQADGTSESTLLDAVVEGDAERVAALYRESLPPRKRKALDAGTQQEITAAQKKTKQVPKVITTMMTSPYTLGEDMVKAVAQDGGNAKVNKLFRELPKDETGLLDPFQALSGNKAAKVDVPKLEDGEKKFASGVFGVVTWYLMLAERMPLQDALAASDGWAGDAYVGFKRDGKSCARMAYAGDTPAGHEADALRVAPLERRSTGCTGQGEPRWRPRQLRDLRPRQGRQGGQERIREGRRARPHPERLRHGCAACGRPEEDGALPGGAPGAGLPGRETARPEVRSRRPGRPAAGPTVRRRLPMSEVVAHRSGNVRRPGHERQRPSRSEGMATAETKTGIQRGVAVVLLLAAGILSLPLVAAFLDGQSTEDLIVPIQLATMAVLGAIIGYLLPGVAGFGSSSARSAMVGAVIGVATALAGVAVFALLL